MGRTDSESRELSGELWNKILLKGHKNRNRQKNRINKEWASSVGLWQEHKPQHPHHVTVAHGGHYQGSPFFMTLGGGLTPPHSS